jgi:multiple sugar transport system substrate-binding protein
MRKVNALSKLSLIAVLSSSMLALSACGSGTNSGNNSSNSDGSSSGPVTITFSSWGGADENKQLLQIIDKINEEHKGEFVIKNINIPSNYDQKLNTELAAGTAPDIFYVSDSNVPQYAKNGALLNLTPYINKYKDQYVVANPDNYFPNSLANDKYNGDYYALPWIAQPVVMYYNPKLFEEHHVPLPHKGWTWDEFIKDAKALTDPAHHVYGYLQSNGWPPVEMYVWSYGGDFFDSNLTKSTLDSPEAVKGIDLMKRMVDEKVVPPLAELANVDIESLFRQGRVAMFAGGAADGNYNTNGFTAKIAEMPKGTQHASFLWIADLAINAHTQKDKDVVFKAYVALLDAIDHWKVVPPVKQYAQNLDQISIPDAPGGHTPADRIPVILDSMQYARSPQLIPKMDKYYTVLTNDIYQPVLSGKTTAQAAAKQAASDLSALLH